MLGKRIKYVGPAVSRQWVQRIIEKYDQRVMTQSDVVDAIEFLVHNIVTGNSAEVTVLEIVKRIENLVSQLDAFMKSLPSLEVCKRISELEKENEELKQKLQSLSAKEEDILVALRLLKIIRERMPTDLYYVIKAKDPELLRKL